MENNKPYAVVSLPLRVLSINSMLYGSGGITLRRWCQTIRGVIEGYVTHYTPTKKPVIIRITAEFKDIKYVCDADNILCSPLINGLKGSVILQDGFQEVLEVRKRTRHTHRDWCTIEVFEV